mmetsp:Transcript_60930/g.178124  ORF Transcript_60930/g.178124 Transcript_60930/m.178124 type:complete len:273 (+) Transcript_60930:240-1058(+)
MESFRPRAVGRQDPPKPALGDAAEAHGRADEAADDGCVRVRVAAADDGVAHGRLEVAAEGELPYGVGEADLRPAVLRTVRQWRLPHGLLAPLAQLLVPRRALPELLRPPGVHGLHGSAPVAAALDQVARGDRVRCGHGADGGVRVRQLCVGAGCCCECAGRELASAAPDRQRHTPHQAAVCLRALVHLPSSVLHVARVGGVPPHSSPSRHADVERARSAPLVIVLCSLFSWEGGRCSSGQRLRQHELHLRVISDLARGNAPLAASAHLHRLI